MFYPSLQHRDRADLMRILLLFFFFIPLSLLVRKSRGRRGKDREESRRILRRRIGAIFLSVDGSWKYLWMGEPHPSLQSPALKRAVKCENRVNFSSTRTVLIRKYPEARRRVVFDARGEESNKYTIRKRGRGSSTLSSATPTPFD